MPEYLPLCAFRQGLLPSACRACIWWQTTDSAQSNAVQSVEKRYEWMKALESSWGTTGLLLQDFRSRSHSDTPVATASIQFAPASAIPRLRVLPFTLAPKSVVVFCFRSEDNQAQSAAKRLMHKALIQLKERGFQEVYAFAGHLGSPHDQERCEFFCIDFLETNGFARVKDYGDVHLLRTDLRGVLSLLTQLETRMKRLAGSIPTPSPAAWSGRGTL